jgi:hypothetical protein
VPVNAENTFLLFNERRPFKLKKEYPSEQWQVISCRLISLKTPVSFRWTVPLRNCFVFFAQSVLVIYILKIGFFSDNGGKDWFSGFILPKSATFCSCRRFVNRRLVFDILEMYIGLRTTLELLISILSNLSPVVKNLNFKPYPQSHKKIEQNSIRNKMVL